jgi:hypothetical protein
MAENRTLKLGLLADTSNFVKGLHKAEKSTQTFSGKVAKYGKMAALGLATAGVAAGALAIKIGIDSVKAAIDDQKQQAILANQLKQTTHATNAQVSAVEDWITKMQFAYGVSDSQLRPALASLVRVTKDVGKAQELTNLAMDISAGTGKDLEAVSTALSKAYNGNLGALKKLGIPLSDAIVKSKDFNQAQVVLAETFRGAAATSAATYAGQMKILSERVSEFKEGIGAKLLPVLSRVFSAINQISDGFGGKTGLAKRVGQASDALSSARDEKYGDSWYVVGQSLKDVADSFGKLFEKLNGEGGKSGIDAIQKITGALTALAHALDLIAGAYGKLRDLRNLPGFKQLIDLELLPQKALTRVLTGSKPNSAPRGLLAGNGVTININGAVDANGTRRQIEQLLKTSARSMGKVNLVGNAL